MVINLAAVIFFCEVNGVELSTHPILLKWCDNMSACVWANTRCKHSLIRQELGKLFIGILISTKLGIQAKWLPTDLNKIADDISRLRDTAGDYD